MSVPPALPLQLAQLSSADSSGNFIPPASASRYMVMVQLVGHVMAADVLHAGNMQDH